MRVSKSAWGVACGLTAAVASTGVALSQDGAEQIIQHRIANYREIGTAFKQIRDELKLGTPDRQKIEESSQLIRSRGADMLKWFPPGSEAQAQPDQSWIDRIVAAS